MTNHDTAFSELLNSVMTEPGRIHAAYTAFHGYSLGNQILAMMQCAERDIPIGPIATFMGWKDRGRSVRKGEKAIQLCMPVTCKRKGETDTEEDTTFTRFIYRNNWFVLSQTEGDDYTPPQTAEWDAATALAALGITVTPFASSDGNCQGYASGREIAVSPVAALPFKTTIHEMAHVVLGHTAEGDLSDSERTPRDIREVEAESTAMLVCAALNQPGVEFSRGYIQHWYQGNEIPEASARRIMKAADQILKAGREPELKG